MRKFSALVAALILAVTFTGCVSSTQTDLRAVAKRAGLSNVTTGDGTFENYTATGYYRATEVGIGVGLPGFVKFFEIFPGQSNEDLLSEIATEAKQGGAEAMINVTPSDETYWGLPFIILGLYVDHADGTGIDLK